MSFVSTIDAPPAGRGGSGFSVAQLAYMVCGGTRISLRCHSASGLRLVRRLP